MGRGQAVKEIKEAQNGPEQIEIQKGNSIQISLDDKLSGFWSGWIGVAVFHKFLHEKKRKGNILFV